ncbi:MAG: FHA domain-containing protein [Anaerolineae bacterium]|nr:FHA domain-containing protein [Anaerolineae bacterium]
MDFKTSALRIPSSPRADGIDGVNRPPDLASIDELRDADSSPECATWRLRLEPLESPGRVLRLDVNNVLTLGRGNHATAFTSLDAFGAHRMGVSRRHVILRATAGGVYISDLGSRNGSRLNGQPMHAFTFYNLRHHDRLSLGLLEFTVQME